MPTGPTDRKVLSRGVLGWIALLEALVILFLLVTLPKRDTGDDRIATDERTTGYRPAVPGQPVLDARPSAAEQDDGTRPAETERAVVPDTDRPVRLVHGRVTTEAGDPVGDAPVWFGMDDGEQQALKTQSDGQFAIAGLSPGSWTIRVIQEGFRPYEATLDLVEETALPVRHDVQLHASLMIAVRIVLPDGRSVRDVPAEELGFRFRGQNLAAIATTHPVRELPLTNLRSVARTGIGQFRQGLRASGRWVTPPEGVIGFLEVHVPPPFFISAILRQTVLASARVTEPIDQISLHCTVESLRSSTASATIRIVDAETSMPLTNGRVALNDRQSGGGGVRPDEQGIARMEPLAPGLLVLEPMFSGYEAARHYVRVEPGARLDLGTLALHKGVSIQGRVMIDAGDPTRVSISVRNMDRMLFPQPFGVGLSARPDKDGFFELARVGRGPQLLLFQSKDLATMARVVDTSSGGIEDLLIELDPGVPVTIRRPDQGDGSLLWQVLNEQSHPLISGLAHASYPLQIRLPPGSYLIRVYEDQVLRLSRPFSVDSTPLDFEVSY